MTGPGRQEDAMLGAKAVARAKINLFLDILGLRGDGYHDIRSLMQSLELADELYFRRTDGSRGQVVIRCSDQGVPTGGDNLVSRAVEVFADGTGALDGEGVEVLINKKIPVGAGLAGGSADAAAALLSLRYMFELDIEDAVLVDMGAKVGSDVPFCLKGGTALVSGRGEVVETLEPLPPFKVVLASTGEEVSTREVYQRFDRLHPEGTSRAEDADRAYQALMEGVRNRDFEGIYANLHNGLESATIATDRVNEFKTIALEAGAAAALMTGSGPTVFALVSGMEEAAEVAWELEKTAPVTIITSFANRGAEISAL
jgi:4-diphosphocytidyl-2-C-methyl-D-erythritol kinase